MSTLDAEVVISAKTEPDDGWKKMKIKKTPLSALERKTLED
jgi:hypothetical protein